MFGDVYSELVFNICINICENIDSLGAFCQYWRILIKNIFSVNNVEPFERLGGFLSICLSISVARETVKLEHGDPPSAPSSE